MATQIYVAMQKRGAGKLYADMHKVAFDKFASLPEDADLLMAAIDPEIRENFQIVPIVCMTEAEYQEDILVPDLLEALNAMLDTCYDLERDDNVISAVAKARAAIAKAKGEA